MDENKAVTDGGLLPKGPKIVTDATMHGGAKNDSAQNEIVLGVDTAHVLSVDADRFDRQKRIPKWDQTALEKQNVLVIGAGALGNEVCKLLFQLGVGKVRVVDFDTVVAANLNRCVFFTPEDAKQNRFKADALAARAKTDYPNTHVIADRRNVDQLEETVFSESTAVFGCLDNLGARLHVNAHAYGKAPLFDGGTTGFLGKVQVVSAPSACLECSMSKSDYKLLWQRYSCVGEVLDVVDPKTPAIATTTSIVAAIQVNEFLKHVFGQNILAGKYLHYDGLSQKTEGYVVAKRKGCPVHPDMK
ncbi:ThiF family adenylyltransferase [Candidatus Micrarchaeota archaeon]|nr:ThiF family adenylyltransferase [Candidatus Micrarchaeota archaeon]